jgi:hypothetical protein
MFWPRCKLSANEQRSMWLLRQQTVDRHIGRPKSSLVFGMIRRQTDITRKRITALHLSIGSSRARKQWSGAKQEISQLQCAWKAY